MAQYEQRTCEGYSGLQLLEYGEYKSVVAASTLKDRQITLLLATINVRRRPVRLKSKLWPRIGASNDKFKTSLCGRPERPLPECGL